MHPTPWQLTLLLLVAAVFCFAEATQPVTVSNQNQIKESDILAEYDGGVITRQDLDNKISKLPPQQQGRYRTVDGQIQVLDIMAVEEAFMAKARQLNMEADPDVQMRIKRATRQMLTQEYYKRNISDLLVITEADKRKYYDDNKQAFYLFPYIAISYIQTTNEESAREALAELNAGASFADVSDKYNVNNYAKGLKGELKNIRLNGNVPGIGNDLELERYIAESEADSTRIYGPFKTATGWHIFRTNQYVAGRQKSFEEVLPELDQRTRPGVESRLLDELTGRLKEKYAVVVDSTRISEVDLYDKAKNEPIKDVNLVSSNNPELNITVAILLERFAALTQQEQLFYSKGEGPKQLLEQEIVNSLLYLDAKEQNLEAQLAGNPDYEQMKRFFILNVTFTKLVLETITVSSEECRAYYDEHIQDYTVPAYRTLQALWFDDEETAGRILKMYRRYVTLGDDARIDELIAANSTKPKLATLDNVYDNGIITGVGPDETFSGMAWDNPVGYISPVFKSARGDILFFRVVQETPATAQSFTELEPRIYGILKQQRTDQHQNEVTQQLFEEFNMVKYPEKLSLELTAEDLFTMADNSAKQRNFKDAITFYDQIIRNFANGSDDYRASFMKAFIIAEEMKDETQALQLFKDFLKKYPEGELNESAQFMIDSLEGGVELELE